MNNQIAVFIDFENVALWAEHEFIDFELTPLLEQLQSRGPVVIKRAYGDWSRFTNYRDELMNNAIDLIQIYSVRAGKNRADIRMAMDALEVVMTREHIHTFVIVSGDSDFGPLITKLREYGRYTLGIGPRNITHPLLVKSCDEFVYLETLLGEVAEAGEPSPTDHEAARNLMLKALQAHSQRGELPVPAAKLKHTMLLIDPAFNETQLGYAQFKDWLEVNRDLLNLYTKDAQTYAAPRDFAPPDTLEFKPLTAAPPAPEAAAEPPLSAQYRQLFTRLKLLSVDFATRRDVLRDVYRGLSERPGLAADEFLSELHARYESQGLLRNMPALQHIWQMAATQRAFDYGDQAPSAHAPVRLAAEVDSEAALVRRAECGFMHAIIYAGLELDCAELAALLINDRHQTDYIQSLLDDLEGRGQIVRAGDRYSLPGRGAIPFADDPALQILRADIQQAPVPEGLVDAGPDKARTLAKTAMVQRSQDFAASARSYLVACRLQWEAVEKGLPGATLEDLRWYMASYASVRAGQMSQVQHNYTAARQYYLAFFALVQEEDPLWGRMRGLINPMLSYYWINASREFNINITLGNPGAITPAQVAVLSATHPNAELRQRWHAITEALAHVNPSLLRRVSHQLRLNQSAAPENAPVADQIDKMLNS